MYVSCRFCSYMLGFSVDKAVIKAIGLEGEEMENLFSSPAGDISVPQSCDSWIFFIVVFPQASQSPEDSTLCFVPS